MAYPTAVLADNPFGYWRLGETGSTAEDSSSQNNDLTFPASGISKNVGSLLNADPANGAATFINTTANGSIARTGWTTASLEAWVNIASSATTSSRPIVSIFDASSGFSLNFGIRNDPRAFYVQRGGSILVVPGVAVPIASTFHFALTLERIGSNDFWTLYLNGTLAWSFANNTATAITDWSSIRIGAGGSSTTVTLDEVAVFPTVLSASRIQTHYEIGSATLPVNTVAPALTGTARVGETLLTTDGTWTGSTPTYARAWERSENGSTGWTTISGASSSSYTLTSSDAGKYLRSSVTATNTAGSVSARSAASAQVTEAPANTVAPSFSYSGSLEVGTVLTGSAGTFTGAPTPDLTFSWQRSSNGTSGWSSISGATASTYTATPEDAGQHLRLQVTGTNTEGSATASSTSAGPVIWAPANTVLPALTHDGILEVGNVVTASSGAWTGFPTPDLSYQWQRSSDGSTNWTSISGATSSTYTPTGTDAGKHLRCRVVGESTSGSATVFSAASSYVAADPATVIAPSVSGLTRPGQTLTAEVGEWSGFPNPSFSFQWFKSSTGSTGWTALSGQTGSALAIPGGGIALGNFYRVQVTGTNEAGSASAASAAVGPVTGGSNSTAAIVGALAVSATP